MTPHDGAVAASSPPDSPMAPDGPAELAVFAEPWQAQAFAIVVELHRRGLYTWREWTDALAARIAQAREAGDPDLGDGYYGHWLAALEAIVAAKGAAAPGELARYAKAWSHAAGRTPHGRPIELSPRDFDAPAP